MPGWFFRVSRVGSWNPSSASILASNLVRPKSAEMIISNNQNWVNIPRQTTSFHIRPQTHENWEIFSHATKTSRICLVWAPLQDVFMPPPCPSPRAYFAPNTLGHFPSLHIHWGFLLNCAATACCLLRLMFQLCHHDSIILTWLRISQFLYHEILNSAQQAER